MIVQEYKKEIKPVFISDRKIIPSELHKVMRRGYREATPNEIIQMYTYGNYLIKDFSTPGFAEELYDAGGIMTSHKGLPSSGRHEILDDGSFKRAEDNFDSLPSERRAWHIPGNNYLMFGCHLPYEEGDADAYLRVSADDFDDMTQLIRVNFKTKSIERLNLHSESKKHYFAYTKDDNKTILINAYRYSKQY